MLSKEADTVDRRCHKSQTSSSAYHGHHAKYGRGIFGVHSPGQKAEADALDESPEEDWREGHFWPSLSQVCA